MDKQIKEYVRQLEEIYDDGDCDYEIKVVENGSAVGFYLFFPTIDDIGHLLCSHETIEAFIAVESTDMDHKDKISEYFTEDAAMMWGFEREIVDPDVITWRKLKELIDELPDEMLDEKFTAGRRFHMMGNKLIHAKGINTSTNTPIMVLT